MSCLKETTSYTRFYDCDSPQFWSKGITKYIFRSPFLNVFHSSKPAILAVGRDTWSRYEYWLVAHAVIQMSQLIHIRHYQTSYNKGCSCLVTQFCADLWFAKHAQESNLFLLCRTYVWVTNGARTWPMVCAQKALNICCVTSSPVCDEQIRFTAHAPADLYHH